jgi:hypothetical protein
MGLRKADESLGMRSTAEDAEYTEGESEGKHCLAYFACLAGNLSCSLAFFCGHFSGFSLSAFSISQNGHTP